MKKRINKHISKIIYAFLIITIIKSIGIFLLLKLNTYIEKKYIILFFLIILIIDIFIFTIKILKINKLKNAKVSKCILEDVFFKIKYVNNKREYEPILIVRNISDNKLYSTFSNARLIGYNCIKYQNGSTLLKINIRKENGEYLKIGDNVYIFSLKNITVNVNYDYEKQVIMFNNNKLSFKHVNDNFDINDLNSVIFFEGYIEIN